MNSSKVYKIESFEGSPSLRLTGDWLDKMAFPRGTLTTLDCKYNEIIIKSTGVSGLEGYRKIISDVRKNNLKIIEVGINKNSRYTHTSIWLYGAWLNNFGFSTGVSVIATFANDVITIRVLTLERLLAPEFTAYRINKISKIKFKDTNIPIFWFNSKLLKELGFNSGKKICASFNNKTITLGLTNKSIPENAYERILTVSYSIYNVPIIRFGGVFLKNWGFNIGDLVLIQYKHEVIKIILLNI